MRSIKDIMFAALFCLNSFISDGQSQTIDSLKRVLQFQKEDTGKITTLNQLSLEFINSEKLVEGYGIARQLLSLATKLNNTEGKGRAMVCVGYYLERIEKYEDARQRYDSAVTFFRESGNKDMQAAVYGSIASTYLGEQNSAASLEYIYMSLKLLEETGNGPGVALAYLSLGGNSLGEKDYEAAIKYFTLALDGFKKVNDKLSIATVNSLLAKVYFQQNTFEKALLLDSIALKLYDDANSIYNTGAIFTNRGNIYEKQGDISTRARDQGQAKLKYSNALQ